MPFTPRRIALAVVVGLLVVPLAAAADELEEARDRADTIDQALIDATERYERTVARIEEDARELEEIERREIQLGAEVRRMEQDLARRAREIFKHGATTELNWLLAATDATAAMDRAAYGSLVQNRELAGLEETVAARESLDQLTQLASRRRSELLELEGELHEIRAKLETELDEATTRVVALEAVAHRQRRIDQGDQQGVYACPLDPGVTHFIDSWGFARSGGRSHKGTDIMGPMGAEVYAFTDGVIARRSSSRLGGNSLYLRGDDGGTYYYAHLQGYAAKGVTGTRVLAGDVIAYNGNSGNARGGAPHIHLERKPGGGSSVNPYPWLANACF